ncbi:MAG: hypothetical protein MRY74_16480 [Neomegalonema sp.]|nr:hypothetical protein [Neomegalonema sp.]
MSTPTDDSDARDALRRASDALRIRLARLGDELSDEPGEAEPAPIVTRIKFASLAADIGQVRELPEKRVNPGDPAIEVRFAKSFDGVTVDLQALGLPALRRLGGRKARFISADMSVDYAFRFDPRGRARLLLSANTAVVGSLADGFHIDFVEAP